jgi:hypothetical protein
MEHKMAAFDSMLYRACNLPHSSEKEVAYIKETAGLNGYSETTIDGLVISRKSPHCHPSAKRLQLSEQAKRFTRVFQGRFPTSWQSTTFRWFLRHRENFLKF